MVWKGPRKVDSAQSFFLSRKSRIFRPPYQKRAIAAAPPVLMQTEGTYRKKSEGGAPRVERNDVSVLDGFVLPSEEGEVVKTEAKRFESRLSTCKSRKTEISFRASMAPQPPAHKHLRVFVMETCVKPEYRPWTRLKERLGPLQATIAWVVVHTLTPMSRKTSRVIAAPRQKLHRRLLRRMA